MPQPSMHDFINKYIKLSSLHFIEKSMIIITNSLGLGHNRPLTLPEPEPTLPFDLPLSEPTYQHRPDLTAFLSPIFC